MNARLAAARVALAYRWRHGHWPDLAAPRRFTEWVQWRKLNDRDADRARLTDKSHSKRLVARTLGEGFVIPTLWEGEKLPTDAPWPMPFIVKANHGCRQFVIVRTPADYRRARTVAPRWLARSYGGWLDEWHYRAARRSILVEPLIDSVAALPVDYKIYVFGGEATMIQVHEDRAGAHRWAQYDRAWTQLSRARASVGKPSSLGAMLDAAERLGSDHDFVRVDFYEVEGKPLFGEFCLYPGSGLDPFAPTSLDTWLGQQWGRQRPERRFGAGQGAIGAGAAAHR